MRRLLGLTMLAAGIAAGATITQTERDGAAAHLEETRAKFLSSIRGLTAGQWSFKPAPEVWSVAEVAEHITVSESTILDLITKKILATPVDPAQVAEAKGKDQQVLVGVPDRSQKFQAPEFLRPQARWSQAELPGVFIKSRDLTVAFLRTTPDDLRSHTLPHPVLKALDAYQWVLLISAHSQRHTAQIEEVKAHPNFPKVTSATLTPAERDKAISHLEKTRAAFLTEIRGLSAEQWSFKPAPEVWSVAEVAEHITVSEGSIVDLAKKILSMPASAELLAKAQGKDDEVLRVVPDRTRKNKAPEILQPQKRWTQAQMAGEFNARRDRTIEFIRTTEENLRGHAVPNPGFQALDAYQWILLLSAHSQRHTAQVQEVKTHLGYPR